MFTFACFLNDLHLTDLQNLKMKYFQHYVTFTEGFSQFNGELSDSIRKEFHWKQIKYTFFNRM